MGARGARGVGRTQASALGFGATMNTGPAKGPVSIERPGTGAEPGTGGGDPG